MIHIDIPTIEELETFKDVSKIPEVKGVYFILNENKIPIYIGQSINIRKRIRAHLNKGKTASPIRNKNEIVLISFIYFYEEKHISLDGIERIYIDLYKPKYNDIPIIYIMPSIEEQREALKDIPMR